MFENKSEQKLVVFMTGTPMVSVFELDEEEEAALYCIYLQSTGVTIAIGVVETLDGILEMKKEIEDTLATREAIQAVVANTRMI